MDAVEPPKPTGRATSISFPALTGFVFPWDGGQPVLLRMPGSPHWYLPLFQSAADLETLMAQANVPFRSIKQVEDGSVFISTLLAQRDMGEGQELKIIINPYYLPNGRVRFTELKDG